MQHEPSAVVTPAVCIVTGPSGAGKSTVAGLLAQELSPAVHLHSDDFWHYIRSGHIPPHLPESQRQNEVVMDALAHAAFRYAGGGYHVFCDGVIGPWFLSVFRDAASAYDVELHYVVLRPDEATTIARATSRADGLTDIDVLVSLYHQFADLGDLEAHALDTTKLTADGTAAAVLTGMRNDTFRLPRRT
jgi:predicted kinase